MKVLNKYIVLFSHLESKFWIKKYSGYKLYHNIYFFNND